MDNDQEKATIIGNGRTGGHKMWIYEDTLEQIRETGRRIEARVSGKGNRFTPKKKKRK